MLCYEHRPAWEQVTYAPKALRHRNKHGYSTRAVSLCRCQNGPGFTRALQVGPAVLTKTQEKIMFESSFITGQLPLFLWAMDEFHSVALCRFSPAFQIRHTY
jgi:hypothetical protein